MSVTLTQAERWLTLDTPLGEDVLVAIYAKGTEGISRLFDFRIEALSTRQVIDPSTLLGKSVTLAMAHPGEQPRHVNGIVTAFSGGAVTRSDYRLYTLTVSPALWLLQRTSDYKVFQEKTAVDIAPTTTFSMPQARPQNDGSVGVEVVERDMAPSFTWFGGDTFEVPAEFADLAQFKTACATGVLLVVS